MYATVKRDKRLLRLGWREERRRDPGQRCNAAGDQSSLSVHEGVAPRKGDLIEPDRNRRAGYHGGDFTPRIDPPPVAQRYSRWPEPTGLSAIGSLIRSVAPSNSARRIACTGRSLDMNIPSSTGSPPWT